MYMHTVISEYINAMIVENYFNGNIETFHYFSCSNTQYIQISELKQVKCFMQITSVLKKLIFKFMV